MTAASVPSAPSTSPPTRFDLLDGLRGVAAVAVMVYHYTLHNSLHWLAGAWMAVDLFFVLSGFVIAHSFGRKIVAGMGLWRFVGLRLIRLGPLYVVGLLLGLGANLVLLGQSEQQPFTGTDLAVATFWGALWLPCFNNIAWPFGPHAVQGPIFPLNDPAWSLFFELFANLVFYLYVARTGRLSGKKLVLAAGMLFVGCTLYFRQFNPGWGQDNFIFGFPRVTAEFFLGALIYQLQLHQRKGSWVLALLMGALVLPFFLADFARSSVVNALVLMPLAIVFLSRLPVDGWVRSLCAELGELSYPLYIVHFPVYRLAYNLSDLGSMPLVTQVLVTSALSVIVALLLAQADRRWRQRLQAWFVGRSTEHQLR